MPYTTSTVVFPLIVRSRWISKPCCRPGHFACSVSRVVVRNVRRSPRPWFFSTVLAHRFGSTGTSSVGGKSRGDGTRRGFKTEPRANVDFQAGLIGFDGEEVIAALRDD